MWSPRQVTHLPPCGIFYFPWHDGYWEKDAEDGVARKEETGKAKKEVMDVVKEDMAEVEVTEEDS